MTPPASFPQPRLMSSTQIRYQPFSPSAEKSVPSDKQPLPPRTDSIHASHPSGTAPVPAHEPVRNDSFQGSQVQSRTQHFQPLDPWHSLRHTVQIITERQKSFSRRTQSRFPHQLLRKVSFAKAKYSAQSFARFFAGIPFSVPVAHTG